MAKRKTPRIFAVRADGSEEALDAVQLRIVFGGPRNVDISISTGDEDTLTLRAPGDDNAWGRLVLHPGAANVVDVELRMHKRSRKPRRSPK